MQFEPRIAAVIDQVEELAGRVDDAWQVPRVEAEFLAQVVRAGGCQSLCEIGVSYGFSTLHLAAATAPLGGHLHGFELNPKKIAAATEHLTAAGLATVVTLHEGDARETVAAFTPEEPYDFVFIDSTKELSFAFLEAVWPHLAPNTMVLTDNTSTHPTQLADFVAHLRGLDGWSSVPVPVGNGFELTVRRAW